MAALQIKMGQNHQLSLQSYGSDKKMSVKTKQKYLLKRIQLFIYTVLKVEIRHDTFSNMN